MYQTIEAEYNEFIEELESECLELEHTNKELRLFQLHDIIIQEPTFEEYKRCECDINSEDSLLIDNFKFNYKGEEYYFCDNKNIKSAAFELVENYDLSYEKMLEVLFSVFSKEEFLKSGQTLESLEHKEYYKQRWF